MGIFDAVAKLFGYVLWFFFDLFDNYPLAVLCFTVVVRLVVLPFELKSRRASAQIAKLNKKQAEIQKKYKNNQEKQQEELAKLYQQEGNGLFGGCLPQLIPMVSFMGVFFAITRPLTNMFHLSADKVAQAIALIGETKNHHAQLSVVRRFALEPQLFTMFSESEVSDLLDFNKGFNFFGLDFFSTPISTKFLDFAWIWPALCIITMIISTVIMQKLTPTPEAAQPGCMRFFPYLLSLPFLYVTINAPAAVGFYYAISNVLTIIQNIFIAKFYNNNIITAKQEAARIALRDQEEAKVDKKF